MLREELLSRPAEISTLHKIIIKRSHTSLPAFAYLDRPLFLEEPTDNEIVAIKRRDVKKRSPTLQCENAHVLHEEDQTNERRVTRSHLLKL